MIPHRTPFFLPLLYPSLAWRISTNEKELYLTFDDGPVPGPTDFVLAALAEVSAKATFFCIGDNIRKHPEVFKSVIAHGHAVGNHTFNHLNGWKTKTSAYVDNIEQCSDQLKAYLSNGNDEKPVTLFRPPYGRITREQIHALKDYKIIMWDVLSVDYNKHLSAEACLRNTIKATRPGSIIVFHDSVKAEKNMMFVLPRLLAHFSERGFVFKALS